MKAVNKKAKKVMDTLTEGLPELGDHILINNSSGIKTIAC